MYGEVTAPSDGKCVYIQANKRKRESPFRWRGNFMRVLVWMACANESCYQPNKTDDTQTLATDAPNGMIQ